MDATEFDTLDTESKDVEIEFREVEIEFRDCEEVDAVFSAAQFPKIRAEVIKNTSFMFNFLDPSLLFLRPL